MNEKVKAIKEGNIIIFEQVFNNLYPSLCAYAESIVRDKDVAEDIVQNTFCNLWENRKKLNIHESFKSYIYRSVYNAAIDNIKHEKVKLSFIEFIREQENNLDNNIQSFFDKEEENIIVNEINRAISTLPDQCREILLLSRFSGNKNNEIAEILQISTRTVETQLYRAMKKLREELSHLKGKDILLLFLFQTYRQE